MTIEQTRRLELLGADVSRELALMLDEMFFRVEVLERDNRRLKRVVAALEERMEPVALVPSGAYDPRD